MPQDLGAPWADAFLGKKWVSVRKVVGCGLQASNMVSFPELCHVCWEDSWVYRIFGFLANFA